MANYAQTLTRDYLEYLGITKVSEDGTKIMKGDKELKQHSDGHYLYIHLYDPALRQSIPVAERTASSGQVSFGVHRVVYCWYNRICPVGLVVDHQDNNKLNNHKDNLQLLPPGANIWKDRDCNTREIKCKLDRPRSFYEDKLAGYEELYLKAKDEGRAAEAHKQRTNIANVKARLRYWDSHRPEIEESLKNKVEEKAKLDKARLIKKESVRDRKILEQYKQMFREAGNKEMWRQMIKVIKTWDTLEQVQKDHVFDVLHNFFSKYGKEF